MREYIIGDVKVEIVDGSGIRVNGVEVNIKGIEDSILNNMVNQF
ncbi:hypothetical protein [Clostridium estertheticum]|nr:hypothetical protein [Clostridium estertheticum]